MNEKQKNQIIDGIEVIKRNLIAVNCMLETMKQSLQSMDNTALEEEAVLNRIKHWDRVGINKPMKVLQTNLNSKHAHNLLLKGEIMEIGGLIYPFDSKNLQG